MPFTPYNCELKDDAASKIQKRLIELNETDSLDMISFCLNNYKPTENFNRDSANYLQKLHNADMIIYGNYTKSKDQCNSDNVKEFCYYWQMDSTKSKILQVDTSQNKKVYINTTLELLNSGKLQAELEEIVFWVAAQRNSTQGKYNKAIKKLYFLIDSLKSNKSVYFSELGHIFIEQGLFSKALFYYNKAIQLKPQDANLYFNFGYAYYRSKKYDMAKIQCDKAIKLDSNNIGIYTLRGMSYSKLNKYDSAIIDYNKGIKLDSNDKVIYNNRGAIYHKLQQYNLAIEDYNRAIELDNNFEPPYHNRQIVYDDLKKYDLLIKDIDKVITFDKDNENLYITRASFKYIKRDLKGACNDITRAKSLGYSKLDLDSLIKKYCK